eukprot:Skav219677  [mRNA]  locus=scaffold4838:125390:128437:- [translate_table: standard]
MAPSMVNGVEVQIGTTDIPEQFTIQNLPKGLGASFELEQTYTSNDPKSVADAFFNFWAPYWLRDQDAALSDINEWSSFVQMCQQVPDLNLQGIENKHTVDEWKWAISHTKSTTARGVCGFSQQELNSLVPSMVEVIIDIFHRARGCGLPPWLMISKVFLVPKVTGASSISEMRPITVMSLLLRIWGKVTAKRLLQQWKYVLPPNIVGAMPERSCSQLTLSNAVHIEGHLQLGWDAGGFSLDIAKCFNGFPRLPLKHLLAKGGLDDGHSNLWFLSLQHLSRCACLLDSISVPSPSTTGVPEGDPMSVCAMVMVGYAWHSLVSAVAKIRTSIFADDWSWEGFTAEDHLEAFRLTMAFLDTLKLKSDPRKCWCWGTTPRARKIWKSVSELLFGDPSTFRTSIAERELGVCMHYAKTTRHGCTPDRLKQGTQRLERLRRLPLGSTKVAHIITTCIWPQALFGSDTVYIGAKHFDKLRGLAVEALVVKTKATLNHLAINLIDAKMIDPLFYVISRALSLWRRMLLRDTTNCHVFYQVLANASDDPNKAYGPAVALKCYLAAISWTIDAEANITTHRGISFSLCTVSPRRLVQYLWSAWDMLIASHLTQREDFRDWPEPDTLFTHVVPLPDDPRAHTAIGTLRSLGTLFHTQRQHWQNNDEWDNSVCPLCGGEDSRSHFPFQCPGTLQDRLAHANTLARAKTEFPHLCFLPVMHKHPSLDALEAVHEAREFPAPFLCDETGTLGVSPTFYTDGSSGFPTHPSGGIAAWAIIRDLIPSDELRIWCVQHMSIEEVTTKCFEPMQIAMGVGQQTINRVELQAIIQIIRSTSSAIMHSDSAWAIQALVEVQECPHFIAHAHKSNSDLYHMLCELAMQKDLSKFQCFKVAAHQDPNEIADPLERYRCIANNYVDSLAKRGIHRETSPLHRACWEVAEWYDRQKSVLQHVSTFLAMVHCKRLDAFDQQVTATEDTGSTGKFSLREPCNWSQPMSQVTVPEQLLDAFLPGGGDSKVYLRLVHAVTMAY